MSPFETARRQLHSEANSRSLQAVLRMYEEREAELIEELAGDANAVEIQTRFKELRLMRDALQMPVIRPPVVRDAS